MELKTLKDLSQEIYENCGSDPEPILKQEAIKWVKDLEDNNSHNGSRFQYGYFEDGERGSCEAPNVIEWIKDFFNLTDEDLN